MIERVNTPVPGPSSITGADAGVRSEVMAPASAALDGVMAPMRRGLTSQARKNESAFMLWPR